MRKKIKDILSSKKGGGKQNEKGFWTADVLAGLGYNTACAEKLGISRDIIRKTMEKSGWNAYECFCRMLETADTRNVSFTDFYNDRLWLEYKSQQAENLINGLPAQIPAYNINRDRFYDIFLTAGQKEALNDLESDTITVDTLEKFFGITFPDEIRSMKGDIRDRIKFAQGTLNPGDIFLCVPDKYVNHEILTRKKPSCVVGYPSYQETVENAGITFIPRTRFSAYVLDLAAAWKSHFDVKTVAITGSVGKTSTSDMIGVVVDSSRTMHKLPGNQNTTWQLVDSIFKLKSGHEVYVQECSGSFPGQMEKSSRAVQPDIFVLTNIGNGHIGRYDGRQELLLYEKLGLDRHAAENAIGIVNLDDRLLSSIAYHHAVKSFAVNNTDADYYAGNVIEQNGTISFDVVEKDGIETPVEIAVVGIHNVYNALAAFAVGIELGLDREVIAKALAEFETSGARQNLVNYGGQKLYIDCCSATEESLKSAVLTTKNIDVSEGARKFVVLADVQMLGDQSEEIHRRIGRMLCEENPADEIIFYGPEMKYAMEEVLGNSSISCRATESQSEIEKWLTEETAPGDLITFKAGHIMACQWIIDDIWGTNFYLHDKFTTNAPVVPAGNEKYKCIDDYGCALISADRTAESVALKGEVNGQPLRIIDNGVFRKSALREIEICDTVSSIGKQAFQNSAVVSVSFPSGLKYIGQSAFAGCKGIETLDLSGGCDTIDSKAFSGCSGLKTVILPDSVRTIADNAFDSDCCATFICSRGTYAAEWAEKKAYKLQLS